MNCDECDVPMEISRQIGYEVPAPTHDTQPDFICSSVEWHCPECGAYFLEDLDYPEYR